MDPLGRIENSVPKPLKVTAKQIGLNTYFTHLKKSSLYRDFQVRHMEKKKLRFETAAGEFVLLVPDYSSGVLVTKSGREGGYEPGLVRELASISDKNDVLYDIGAGYGYNAKVGESLSIPSKNIHLFEMNWKRVRFCKLNSPESNRTQVRVGDGSDGTFSVDSYAKIQPSPSIVTMDIEGAELDALYGLEKTLETARPRLYIEVHPELLGAAETDLLEYLQELGYELSVMNHRSLTASWSADIRNPSISTEAYTPTYLLRAVIK
ncbi:FkbM family methyltransferase [Natronosalvus halobius]|uniref:FkbM family methyltransferase n=1 Tax=Natronosalvus halobius TaxID=2953746 RepID=UPI00209DD647|nr:FkbM family methyltransferase [Natronosalvus halobius]USZ71455.1 FkbM family methyltransferase [Natronosalvus halobius]